jgi:organic radical activating enzyme
MKFTTGECQTGEIAKMNHYIDFGETYWSCEWQEGGLTFSAPSMHICCITHHNGLGAPLLARPYNGEPLDIEKLIKDRDEVTARNQHPERNPACAGCAALRKRKWPAKHYPFDVINLSHWRKCNLRCIYCYTVIENMPELDETYQALPLMKQLVSENALDPKAQIFWGGGEPTILGEFEALFHFFNMHGIYQHLNTNGVAFSIALFDALPTFNGELMVSVDAGTAETFKLLKKANAFDRVMRNLSKYADAAADKITAKFILKDESCNEVIDFLNRVEDAGITAIRVDVDNHEPVLKENIINAGNRLAAEGRNRGMTVHLGGCGDIGFPENQMKKKVMGTTGERYNICSTLKENIIKEWNRFRQRIGQ